MKSEETFARSLRGVRPEAAARIARILAAEKEHRKVELHNVSLSLTKRELDLLIHILERLAKGREARVVGVGVLAVNDMLLQIAQQGLREAAGGERESTE